MTKKQRRPQTHIPPGEAVHLLMAPKRAQAEEVTWTVALVDGMPISARLRADVTCGPHDLVMTAEWKGPEEQQIRLAMVNATWNIARLCLTRLHDSMPHWHCLDRLNGAEGVAVPSLQVPSEGAEMDDLIFHFAVETRIDGLNIAGRLPL